MSGNGHDHRLGYDLGSERDLRPPKPCCHRMGPGQWCQLDEGHVERGELEHRTSAEPTDYPPPGTMAGKKIAK